MRKLIIISVLFLASASAQAQRPNIGSVLSVIATMWRAEPAQKFFAEPSAPGILVRS